MKTVSPRTIITTFAIFVVAVLIYAWHYITDIHRKFPDIDLKKSRIGIASWYSENDRNINKHTANLEVFNDKDLTCATWHYDFGEELLVINAFTGAWVVCRVNDRGPAKSLGREIDLTKAAFKKIARLKKGLIKVFVIPTQKVKKPETS